MVSKIRIYTPFLCCIVLALLAVPFYASSSIVISEELLNDVEAQYGIDARNRVFDWGVLMMEDSRNPTITELGKMNRANDYFNQVRWLSDLEHWGQEDYWATPVETLATNGGDCEDYSIGKYFSLLKADFDPTKLRITYVKSLTYNQAHMVLAYYDKPSAEPLILDNIKKEILPASERPDLFPIYSFNGESIWMARGRGENIKGSSQKSLPSWKKLNERMRNIFR